MFSWTERLCWPITWVPSMPRSSPRSATCPILTTAAAQELGAFPQHVYQWHREGFGLAHGARLLATSTGAFPNQAFSYGSAIAVQFHPEITYAQLHRWTGHN